MAYKIVWSTRAVEDLEAIAEYIASDSGAYAAAVVEAVLSTTRKHSHFPLSGRTVPELDDASIREWFVYGYRIIYQIENEVITIAAVILGKRLLDLK